jgi:hypothetical protein
VNRRLESEYVPMSGLTILLWTGFIEGEGDGGEGGGGGRYDVYEEKMPRSAISFLIPASVAGGSCPASLVVVMLLEDVLMVN